jgi:hypothetical protein
LSFVPYCFDDIFHPNEKKNLFYFLDCYYTLCAAVGCAGAVAACYF